MSEAPLSTETALDLLAHRLRRELLVCLRNHDEPLALADAADEVAVATENVSSLKEVEPETVTELYLSLYHTHVPKLEERGVVEYEQERDLVALSDRVTRLEPYLELITTGGP